MVFDRQVKLDATSDLVGVGHPLVTRAMQQAENFTGSVAIARGADRPVLVLQISDRVTDGGSHVQAVLIGMARIEGGFEFLRDWQLLLLLNAMNTNDTDGKLLDPVSATGWVLAAKLEVEKHIPALDLPFEVPDIRELVLFWPVSEKDT